MLSHDMPMRAQGGGESRRGGGSSPHPGRFTSGKNWYPLYRGLVSFGSDPDGHGKLASAGIRSSNVPAGSESLYWLRKHSCGRIASTLMPYADLNAVRLYIIMCMCAFASQSCPVSKFGRFLCYT
jgi:hypothetical protein